MKSALGRYSARDLGRGLLSGRFNVPEIGISSSFMFGGFVQGLLTAFDAENPDPAIDQIVEMLLRTLGINADEAKLLAHQPLANLDP